MHSLHLALGSIKISLVTGFELAVLTILGEF